MSEKRSDTKRTYGNGTSQGYKGTSGRAKDSKRGASQGYKGTTGQARDSKRGTSQGYKGTTGQASDNKSGVTQGYRGTSGQSRDNRKEFDQGDKEKFGQAWDSKKESSQGYRGASDQARDSRRGYSQGYKGTSSQGYKGAAGQSWDSKRGASQGYKGTANHAWDNKKETSQGYKGTTGQDRDNRRETDQFDKEKSNQAGDSKRESSQGYKRTANRTWDSKRESTQGYKGTSGADRDSSRGPSRGYKGTSGIGRDSDKGPSQGYRGTSSTDRDSNRGPSQGYRGTLSTDRDSNRGPSQGYRGTASTDRDSNRGSSQGYKGTAGTDRGSSREFSHEYKGTPGIDRGSNRGSSKGYKGTAGTDRGSSRGSYQGNKGTSGTDRGSSRESSHEYKGTPGQDRDNRRGSTKNSNEKYEHSRDSSSGTFQKKNENSEQPLNDKRFSTGQPRCSYIRSCGGCQMQQINYEDHLEEKQKKVESLLKKYCKVESIIGMEKPYHYRNKVHAVFDHDKKGNPISGVYEVGSHRVVSVENCLIEDQKADAIIASIRGLLKSFKILTYDEDTDYGLLRHVLIKKGFTSGEIMVVLVLSSIILPSKNNFVKALRLIHPEITTIIVNVNDRKTSMILGDKEQVIYGKGYIEDSLLGKTFRISPKSFYQINTVQTEILYSKAMELAGLTGEETVIDAYCGVGTIGLIASDHAKTVIGVELNKDAVKDAIANAKLNQVQNIEFYNNDAGEFMSQMAAREEKVDVVFMDPPRTGSDEQFLDALVLLKPTKVVYISCNPETLERDLEYLTKKGYKAEKAAPVDMFPWTTHVETVTLITKVKV